MAAYLQIVLEPASEAEPHFARIMEKLVLPLSEMENLRRWTEGLIESGGFLPVEQIIERLEGASPEKINKRQLTGAADALARLSVGMAPDPRFALRSPKLGEPVVLFRLPQGITALEEVSENYRNILVSIAIGSFVGHADGTIAARERNALETRIEAAALSESEKARLLANLQWMLAVPPDLALFRRHLKDIPESTSHEFVQIALAMAVADDVIDPSEIKAIERLYKIIGLKTEDVYSDLHTLTTRSEPVQPERNNKVVLDERRLASLILVLQAMGYTAETHDGFLNIDYKEGVQPVEAAIKEIACSSSISADSALSNK